MTEKEPNSPGTFRRRTTTTIITWITVIIDASPAAHHDVASFMIFKNVFSTSLAPLPVAEN
jgi:hypothetical protein